MSNMKRFSKLAQRVMTRAAALAEAYDHSVIDLGHFFLALAQEPAGMAGKAIAGLWIDEDLARRVCESIQRDTPLLAVGETLTLSDDLKRVIHATFHVAHNVNENRIKTEHLLLGWAQNDNPRIVEALQSIHTPVHLFRRSILLARRPIDPMSPPTWYDTARHVEFTLSGDTETRIAISIPAFMNVLHNIHMMQDKPLQLRDIYSNRNIAVQVKFRWDTEDTSQLPPEGEP